MMIMFLLAMRIVAQTGKGMAVGMLKEKHQEKTEYDEGS